jgi:hypothetical protein
VGDSSGGDSAPVAFSGEVWTDARGYATVALPRAAGRLHGDFVYELHPYTPQAAAVIAAELIDGRFTIATDEPHVKVAWRIIARQSHVRPETKRAQKRARMCDS